MKSFDTNVLLFATNADCREYDSARVLLDNALKEPGEWIIAEQVYFEFYRLVRSSSVVTKPLTPIQAAAAVDFFRNKSGFLHCCYEPAFWKDVSDWLGDDGFSARNTFDLLLAATLKNNGATHFYTRNVKDFESYRWFDIVDPIGEPI